MPEPIDELMSEIAGLRKDLSAITKDLDDMKRILTIIKASFQSFHGQILKVRDILAKDFESYTQVEVSEAPLLIPSGLATNTKKAVKKWPDPIKKNADKALSTGRRAAKPAAH